MEVFSFLVEKDPLFFTIVTLRQYSVKIIIQMLCSKLKKRSSNASFLLRIPIAYSKHNKNQYTAYVNCYISKEMHVNISGAISTNGYETFKQAMNQLSLIWEKLQINIYNVRN